MWCGSRLVPIKPYVYTGYKLKACWFVKRGMLTLRTFQKMVYGGLFKGLLVLGQLVNICQRSATYGVWVAGLPPSKTSKLFTFLFLPMSLLFITFGSQP